MKCNGNFTPEKDNALYRADVQGPATFLAFVENADSGQDAEYPLLSSKS